MLGVFGITLNQTLFVVGLQRTSVAHAALVIATTPLQVLVLAALRGQEHITLRKIGGMLVAVGGIVVLNLSPGRALHGATPLGDFIVFLGAFSFSLYSVFGKEIALHHDSVTANTLGYAAGALVGAPLLWWQSIGFDYAAVPAVAWWGLGYMTLISSVVCYLIYYYALAHRLGFARGRLFLRSTSDCRPGRTGRPQRTHHRGRGRRRPARAERRPG